MAIPATAALWFLPLVLPICFYVAFTDMREMRIKNHAVYALVVVYLIVGLIALPPWGGDWATGRILSLQVTLPDYAWQAWHLVVILLIGMVLNAAGVAGAGDVKFAAAAAPFIWTSDLRLMIGLSAAAMLGAVATHRITKYTPLRHVAPEWQSWNMGKSFPMGLALSGTLAIYLILGVFFGS